jgi:hypothetical protein
MTMFVSDSGVRTTPSLNVRILAGFLIGFYVLLPLDRGFPPVPLFGRPLNSAIAATLGVLIVLIVQSRGAVLSFLRERYCVIQSIYACVLVAAALRAPSPPAALHWTLLYYCTFVLNYVILRHVTRLHGSHWVSVVVVALGVAAAAVSIVQGVIGIPLPMYDAWFQNYFSTAPENYALPTSRAAGTMNNPVLNSVLMALLIPFALDVKNTRARSVALFTILFAAGLSGSRTVVIVVVFAAGAVVVYRWCAVRALPSVALGLVLLAVSLTWLTPGEHNSRLGLLVDRLTFLVHTDAGPNSRSRGRIAFPSASDPGAQAEVSAALGVSLRKGAVIEGIREMTQEWEPLTWIVGRGSFTAPFIGMRIQPWYNTVDNVFLSVLYERGLLGLTLFVGAFLSFLIATRRTAMTTVHWYAPVTLALAGLSLCWDAYSMFNILVVGSMAIVMRHEEHSTTRGSSIGHAGWSRASTTSPVASLRVRSKRPCG